MKLKVTKKPKFYPMKNSNLYKTLSDLLELLPMYLDTLKKDYENKANALIVAQNNINTFRKNNG